MSSDVETAIHAVGRAAVKVVRERRIVERVVFTGGLSGCGKTMLTPIIGSFARVEIQKFDYLLEQICVLRQLDLIDEAVATVMIRLMTDQDLYHTAMSREVNMRVSDLSSIFRNPGTWRYLRRLVQPGDAAALARIRREQLILHLMVHNVLALSLPLFAALGDAMRIIEVVRHPLHMIPAWRSYIERCGTDERDLNLWLDHHGQAVPFFAHQWEARYLQANPMDKAIYSIEALVRAGQRAWEGLSERQKSQVMIVPFERFVLDPWPYLRPLEELLGTTMTAATRRELRRQRVPRRRIGDSAVRSIYKAYGWEPPMQQASERVEFEKRRQVAANEASPEAMTALDRLSADYEATQLNAW